MVTYVAAHLTGPIEAAMKKRCALGLKKAELVRAALAEYLNVEAEAEKAEGVENNDRQP